MYLPEFQKYIYPASSQDWTLGSPPQWLQPGLNTGITNVFDFREETTNCTDAKTVFGGAGEKQENDPFRYGARSNFWSCAFYPNFTKDIRDHALPPENQTFLLDRQIDASLETSEKVVTFLSTCLAAYCDDSDSCKAPSCAISQLSLNGSSMLSASSIEACLDNICRNEPEKTSNSDIAGIGAVVSYFVQFAISLLCLYCVYALAMMPADIRPQPETDIVKKIARAKGIVETLVIALEDFQRAQCCFAIAIDIASLVTLQDKASMTQQDRTAISLASAAGIAPTTLVLTVLLALNERHSALTFWLTFFTWILSLIVGFHPETLKRRSTSLSYPEACGGFSPIDLCKIERVEKAPGNLLNAFMLTPIVAMPLLLIWHLWSGPHPPKIYIGWATIGTNGEAVRWHSHKFALRCVYVTFVSCTFSFFGFALYLANALQVGDVNMEWSFGQIVAVTVWLPSWLSFINVLIYGPMRGRTQQLPDTLEVVRVSPASNSEETLVDP